LYGDKVLNYSNSGNQRDFTNENKVSLVESVVKEVNKLIHTLKDGEKIGYIYNDTESPIYKELSKDEYKNFIELK
jgi:hypothetical protein